MSPALWPKTCLPGAAVICSGISWTTRTGQPRRSSMCVARKSTRWERYAARSTFLWIKFEHAHTRFRAIDRWSSIVRLVSAPITLSASYANSATAMSRTCPVGTGPTRSQLRLRVTRSSLGTDRQQTSSGCRDTSDAAGAILADALSRTEAAPTVLQVDACGLQCPGPILKLKTAIDTLESGARLELTATDPGFSSDVASWCNMTGNRLVDLASANGVVRALVEKPHPAVRKPSDTEAATRNGSTIVVFSDDMDRALASLVIANGAASAGRQVTLFFTFWGLSLLKKDRKPKVRKDLVGRMFGWMLPDSIDGLKLSKMNFGGVGAALMKARMKQQRVDPIAAMLQTARDAGTRLVACHMSMGVMGVAREELIDGVEIGGVASYLEATETAGLNLFI